MSVPSSVSFQTLSGDFGPVLGEVARLRLSLFREFPYLYDGTEEAEADHLQTYVQAPGALLVLALLISAVVWGFGANSANPHLASRGKLGVLVSCGAAVICGASVTLINFFWNVGQSV